MVNKEDLTINQKAILLSLASLDKRNSRNRIYFEKFLFLLTKSLPNILDDLNDTFDSYKMGPYNEYADELIDDLQDYNLMTYRRDLTEEGERLVQELRNDQESQPVLNKIQELNKTLAGLNTDDLLYLTYNLYPDYATQSLISEKVKSNKLETFKLNVGNIEEGRILSVRSDKGNDIRVKKEGDRLVILED